jgi:hypothetical protein
MINKQVNKTIKAALGKQYSPKIIAHLVAKEIFNENGEAYSADSIQKIVRGERENLTIETEILELVATIQAQRSQLKDRKNRLIKTKST